MGLLLSIAFSFYVLGKVTLAAAQTCYFPDGSLSGRDTPCRATSDGEASACCAWFDICLDNNLCLSQVVNEIVSRGSCTDKSWQSDQCPQHCQDGMFSTVLCAKHEMSYSLAPFRVVMGFVGIMID